MKRNKQNEISPLFSFAKEAKFCETGLKFCLVLSFAKPKKTCENETLVQYQKKSFTKINFVKISIRILIDISFNKIIGQNYRNSDKQSKVKFWPFSLKISFYCFNGRSNEDPNPVKISGSEKSPDFSGSGIQHCILYSTL
jgi:hypothetical protein